MADGNVNVMHDRAICAYNDLGKTEEVTPYWIRANPNTKPNPTNLSEPY